MSFIRKISDQNKYRNVILNKFNQTTSSLPVISLRHDVDGDIYGALEMAAIEHRHNIRSTYFILHTAGYYVETKKSYLINTLLESLDMSQNQNILMNMPKFKK